jgi:hypothetical protein
MYSKAYSFSLNYPVRKMGWTNSKSLFVDLVLLSTVSASMINVACLKVGTPQTNDNISISDGIHDWFSSPKTGCNVGERQITGCNATNVATTCELEGNYDVWDTEYTNCTAYDFLHTQALQTCGTGGSGGGYADCSCAVYLASSCGNCLLLTWSYHVEGMFCFVM